MIEADFNRNGDGQRYRILLEALNHVVFILDENGKFVYVSPGCFEILGLLPEEMVGRAMTSLVVPDDAGRLSSKFGEIKTGTSFPSDYRTVDTKGTVHHVRAVSRLFTDTDGKIYVLGIVGDISTWRCTEDALVVAQAKLEILNSITRHDIDNQLTVIFGYLSFLEDEKPPLPPLEIAQRIHGAATTIQRINRFSKNYQDLGIIAPVWQNVGELMSRARQEVHAWDLDITIGSECAATEILADPMAGKVFFNLLDNSLRHGGHITSVKLTCHSEGDALKIVYEDNGTGIHASTRPAIFQCSKGKSHGYGLFLIREILAITGFTITENGVEGRGVRFEIAVPLGSFRVAVNKRIPVPC
ncbi:MAG: PAS domain-containing sensor histidine kinase [Methanoregula sp.]|uniref:PAS domain S-box protein n=1 Tax=Methanoregula sp. TaxID=2052170 RepID=UPI003C795266